MTLCNTLSQIDILLGSDVYNKTTLNVVDVYREKNRTSFSTHQIGWAAMGPIPNSPLSESQSSAILF